MAVAVTALPACIAPLPELRGHEPERPSCLADVPPLAGELMYSGAVARQVIVSVPRPEGGGGVPLAGQALSAGRGRADDVGHWPAQAPAEEAAPLPEQYEPSFGTPEETLIIFDWDDTLCPSTVCIEDFGLGAADQAPEGELAEQLREYALHAKALIKQAKMVASEVAIVTNAGDGWVASSCSAWLPELASELLGVTIVSARAAWEPLGLASPTDWKEYAFRDIISGFYSKYDGQSWKNVVAIGDAPYEHEALKRVTLDGPHAECCRSKSIRFLMRPSVEVLKRQVDALLLNLEQIVAYDGCLDLQYPGVPSEADVANEEAEEDRNEPCGPIALE